MQTLQRKFARSFIAAAEDGSEFQITEFHSANENTDIQGNFRSVPTIKEFMSEDGGRVNELGNGEYLIVSLGIKVKEVLIASMSRA